LNYGNTNEIMIVNKYDAPEMASVEIIMNVSLALSFTGGTEDTNKNNIEHPTLEEEETVW